jgi:hypothetical protein
MLILPIHLAAKTSMQKIDAAYRAAEITYEKFLENQIFAVFEPNRLPSGFQSASPAPIKCGTPLMTEIFLNWRQLPANTQAILKPYLGRPILTESYISESGRFKIHYDKSGSSAVESTDADQSGIPDFVEEAARSLDYSYRLIVDTLRYTPPPLDGGVEGAEYDLYFYPMGMYGYTQPEKEITKIPPRYTSYTVIHNRFGAGFNTHGLDAVRVTCVHEFFHMVQLGYALRDDDRFFLEMSSTWMEDVAYDDVNDYYAYLPYFFENTTQPFSDYNGYHEYGATVWNFMLEQKHGRTMIRTIWEYIAQYPALEAMDYALIQGGSSFHKELESFSIWNFFTGSRSNPVAYYSEGANYPEVATHKNFSFQNDVTLTDSIQAFGSVYYSFSDPENTRDFMLILQHLQPDSKSEYANFHLDVLSFPLSSAQASIDKNLYIYLDAPEISYWRGNAVIQYADGTQKIKAFSEVTTPEILPLRLFPNPFVSGEGVSFRIQFQLENREWVEVKILSMNGQIIKNIVVPGVLPGILASGFHPEAEWDGTNEAGDWVGSGVYLVCLKTDSFVKFEKISVIHK